MIANSGNLTAKCSASTDRLFYSPAFVLGFRAGRMGNAFRYPDAKGPNPHLRSAQLAYERGRQFGALWRGKSSTNPTEMKAALEDLHRRRIIT